MYMYIYITVYIYDYICNIHAPLPLQLYTHPKIEQESFDDSKIKKKKHNSFDFHEIETAWADIYAIFGRFLGDFGGDVLAI